MFARLSSAAAALCAAALLLGSAGAVALATPQAQDNSAANPEQAWSNGHPDPERMRAFIKTRLDKLAAKLGLKPSQRAAWDAFAKSVEALSERPASRPGKGADAASIARYRADAAAGFAGKLSAIADTTAALQAKLDENQRNAFNEAYRHFRHGRHGCAGHGGPGGFGRAGGGGAGVDERPQARDAGTPDPRVSKGG